MQKLITTNSNISNENWLGKNFSNPDKKIRVGSLFSGIGAPEQALKKLKLNHEIMFAGDIDKFVKKSYFANYDIDESKWHDDVKNFNASSFKGKIDILTGGAPCQPFSQIGKRKGLMDTRGTLFHEFKRIVEEAQPKLFIFENVKGILTHDNRRTWETIKNYFENMNYHIFYSILDSKNYGIPQQRQRVFLLGFKDRLENFEFPAEIPLEYKMSDFLEDYTDSKYYMSEKGVKFVTSTRNRKKQYTQINGEIALCQKSRQQYNWHGDFVFENTNPEIEFDEYIFDVRDVEEKYYLSETVKNFVLAEGSKSFKVNPVIDQDIAFPLLQSMHKMHRAGIDNYVSHMGKIRKLTPRECLRLMGFDDDFKIEVSDTQIYRQAGNSIVVNVLIALYKQIDITNL